MGNSRPSMISWLLMAVTVMVLSGCPTVQMRYAPKVAPVPAPDAWGKVSVGQVEARAGFRSGGPVSAQGQATFYISPPLDRAVHSGLVSRVGDGPGRPVTLTVEDLWFRVLMKDGVGIQGRFCLHHGSQKECFSLEHSVTIRGYFNMARWESEVAVRLVEDFCDLLVHDRRALVFLSSEPVPPQDSALKDRNVNVGPVLSMKNRDAGTQSTGRILWADGDYNFGGAAAVSLGDVKGGLAALAFDFGGNWWSVKGLMAAGGFNISGENTDGDSFDTTVFTNWNFLALLVGHNATVKNKRGYVKRPGVSFLLGPQLLSMRYFNSDFEFTAVEGGGMAVLDLPLGTPNFGLTAGYWAGVGAACLSAWGGGGMQAVSCTDLMFMHSPVVDLWIRSGGSKFNLGLQFLALAAQDKFDAEQLWKNPTIMFTWTRSHGRGAGTQDKSLLLGGSNAYSKSDDLATPVNIFDAR
jgi:hypothetical protein